MARCQSALLYTVLLPGKFVNTPPPVLPRRSHAAGPLPVTSSYPSHRASLPEFWGWSVVPFGHLHFERKYCATPRNPKNSKQPSSLVRMESNNMDAFAWPVLAYLAHLGFCILELPLCEHPCDLHERSG
jgi:hypothetical protein